VELNANDEGAIFGVALCMERGGKYQEAISWYDRGLVLDLKNKKMWLGKGISLQHLGRVAEAKRSLQRALDFDPEYTPAWIWLGRVHIANKKYGDAIEALEKALRIEPGEERAWFSKGVALSIGFGRFDEAVECYDKALESNPHQIEVLMEKGIAHRALGQYSNACSSFEKVLGLQSSNDLAKKNLQACQMEMEKHGESTTETPRTPPSSTEVDDISVDWEGDDDASAEEDAEIPAHGPIKIRCPRCSKILEVDGTPGVHKITCEGCGAKGELKF
jgi:tetratricopeptide (TPR) repeat protein